VQCASPEARARCSGWRSTCVPKTPGTRHPGRPSRRGGGRSAARFDDPQDRLAGVGRLGEELGDVGLVAGHARRSLDGEEQVLLGGEVRVPPAPSCGRGESPPASSDRVAWKPFAVISAPRRRRSDPRGRGLAARAVGSAQCTH
jgi:hypothetical protein